MLVELGGIQYNVIMHPTWLHNAINMATLTIKGVPDTLYVLLKAKAVENRRSLNSEVIVCLEESVIDVKNDREKTLERIRKHRAEFQGPNLTEEFLQKVKNEGRE